MWMIPVIQAMAMMWRRLENKDDSEKDNDGDPEAENEIGAKSKILD